MTITKPLNEIMKKRKLTLRDLYFKTNEEIRLARLSDIRLARAIPTKDVLQNNRNELFSTTYVDDIQYKPYTMQIDRINKIERELLEGE